MSLITAKLLKNWNIYPNIRNAFVSLADMTGWFLFENKKAMLLNGWTVKFTCDGTTGPSGSGDTTDRWITKANASTRGAAAANAQSFAVLQNTDGLQVLLTFQGATDDISRISYSPGGVFTLAAPSTNQPTATDEVVVSTGNSLVSSAVTADRVMTIWCTTDSKQWSHAIFRQGSFLHTLGVERITSYCGVNVFTVPYVGYRHNEFRRSTSGGSFPGPGYFGPAATVSATAIGVAGWLGTAARVFTAGAFRQTRLGCGFVEMCGAPGSSRNYNAGTLNTLADSTALQNGRTPLTAVYWSGEQLANNDGIIGNPIDWWLCYTTGVAAATQVPFVGQFFPGYDPADNPLTDPERSNWLVAFGPSMVRPWRNAAPVLRLY